MVFVQLAGGCSLVEWTVDADAQREKSAPITIRVNGVGASRTIRPLRLETEIVRYELLLEHEDEETAAIHETLEGDDKLMLYELAMGRWTVAVNGYAADGELVGHGEKNFTVSIGMDRIVGVEMELVEGSGHVVVEITWPIEEVEKLRMNLLLTAEAGGIEAAETDLECEDQRIFYRSEELAAGFYRLQIQLHDESGVLRHTITEAVWIVSGRESRGVYELGWHELALRGPDSVTISYDEEQKAVILETEAQEGEIYYTLNGSQPSARFGTAYTGPFSIGGSTEVQAVAVLPDGRVSAVSRKIIEVGEGLGVPQVHVNEGIYYEPLSVELSSREGLWILYTSAIGGMEPEMPEVTVRGDVYEEPLKITENTVIKALVFDKNGATSAVTRMEYQITGYVNEPQMSLAGGRYTPMNSLELELFGDTNAQIYYTLDGSDPGDRKNRSRMHYREPIEISRSLTVKAIGERADWQSSEVVEQCYELIADSPQYSLAGGQYKQDIELLISSDTLGAEIYYTIDGSDPGDEENISRAIYEGAIPIDRSMQVRSSVEREGWECAVQGDENYVMVIAEPQYNLAEGTYSDAQELTITSATAGTTIYYTTDGSDPGKEGNTNRQIYREPIAVNRAMTVRTYAEREGWTATGKNAVYYRLQTDTPVVEQLTEASMVRVSIRYNNGVVIRYTEDGSLPTWTNGTFIANGGELEIGAGKLYRFIALREGWEASEAVNFALSPIPESPRDGQMGRESLRWYTAAAAESYEVQLSRDAAFTYLVVNSEELEESVWEIPAELEEGVGYWWRVRSRNGDAWSDWSASAYFMTAQMNPQGITAERELNWSDVSGAERYAIEISRQSDFSKLDLSVSNLLSSRYALTGTFETGEAYWWRVRYYDGYWSAWSEGMHFIPMEVHPEPGTQITDTINADNPLVLSWNEIAGAEEYEIQLASDEEFSAIVESQEGLLDPAYQVNGELAAGSYWWRIRSCDGEQWSPWSAGFSFSVYINRLMFAAAVSTEATLNLEGIMNADLFSNAALNNERITFSKPFDEFAGYGTYSGYSGTADAANLEFRFDLHADGRISAAVLADNKDAALFVFAYEAGINNYQTFSNSYLSQTVYGTPEDVIITADPVRMNLLAKYAAEMYGQIYQAGFSDGGPTNYHELYHADWKLYNYTQSKVTLIRSYIFHQQFDYGWYDNVTRPIDTERNLLWSPISSSPDQNANLSRSFDIDYLNHSGTMVYIRTSSDNGMSGNVKAYGISSAAADFAAANSGYRFWSISYDSSQQYAQVYNSNCASARLYLMNETPHRILMNGNTTWSLYSQAAAIAGYGDIITSNHASAPLSAANDNPEPFSMVINAGENIAP